MSTFIYIYGFFSFLSVGSDTYMIRELNQLEAYTIFHYYIGFLGTGSCVFEVLVQGSGHTRDGAFVIFQCSAE